MPYISLCHGIEALGMGRDGGWWHGETSVADLSAGGSNWFGYSWTIPATATPGTYEYGGAVYIGDTQISDWFYSGAFTVTGGDAAEIRNIWHASSAEAGQSSEVWTEVRNTGSQPLPQGAVVKHWAWGDGGWWQGETSVAGLSAGGSNWYGYAWTMPATATPGTYEYGGAVYIGDRQISDWFYGGKFTVTGADPDPDSPFNLDLTYGQFTDTRDGQTYKTIQIGAQTWMAENLKYLPEVSPPSEGSNTDPYYYVYDYEGTSVSEAKATENFNTYGALYNWEAALTACPLGWHLPSDAEWTVLTDYLGGEEIAGGKMKSTSSLWWSPNTGATNESGFSGLPGGIRFRWRGAFDEMGGSAYFWREADYSAERTWFSYLIFSRENLRRNHFQMADGMSVRCLRD